MRPCVVPLWCAHSAVLGGQGAHYVVACEGKEVTDKACM